MARVVTGLPSRPSTATGGAAAQRGRTWAHCLALVGVPLLFYEVWTVVAWVADGPRQVTEFRDPNSASWYAAHTLEVLVALASTTVIVFVVRGCRRERRLLTFDVMYCSAGATLFYTDYGVNFFQPVFLQSSNFVNLTNPCGHMPFVINPDCGRAPDPILIWWLLETFCALGLAMALGGPSVRWARSRWPTASMPALLGLIFAGAMAFDALFEMGLTLPLHLYNYSPLPGPKIGFGDGFVYPVVPAVVLNGIYFGSMVAIRALKDDRGRTFLERGLEQHAPKKRAVILLMALYGLFQMIFLVLNLSFAGLGLYQTRWSPALPPHIVNGVCDIGGPRHTRYGPCPGSPGYRMPVRGSLTGRSP